MKRLACALLAVLIVIQSSVPPKAAVAALGSVGAVATVGAFLMASGIYPYITGDDTLSEWTDTALQALIDYYNTQVEFDKQLALNGVNAIKGFLVNGVAGTIAIAKKQWGLLRDFVNWIISEFSLTDNSSFDLETLRTINVVKGGSSATWSSVVNNGSRIADTLRDGSGDVIPFYLLGSVNSSQELPTIYVAYYVSPINGIVTFLSFLSADMFPSSAYVFGGNSSGPAGYALGGQATETYAGSQGSLFVRGFTLSSGYSLSTVYYPIIPDDIVQSSQTNAEIAYKYFFGNDGSVTVDTTTVSVPDTLPDDEEWGGLQVPEATGGVTPEVVIESAIEGRLQPEIKPVSVKIAPDIIVNEDTGQVTQNPVIITGDDVPYSPDAFQAKSLQDKFPFSIPWDIYRIYAAINAPPQRPEFHFTVTFPIVGTYELDVVIPDDIALQVDAFAATVRNMILILLCVWLLFKARDWTRFS